MIPIAAAFVTALVAALLLGPHVHPGAVAERLWLSPLLLFAGSVPLFAVLRSRRTHRLPLPARGDDLTRQEAPRLWPYAQYVYAAVGWLGVFAAVLLWI